THRQSNLRHRRSPAIDAALPVLRSSFFVTRRIVTLLPLPQATALPTPHHRLHPSSPASATTRC
ncbi:hypothetical protein PanWU01x14_142020, partial [Parasponia andersonii]